MHKHSKFNDNRFIGQVLGPENDNIEGDYATMKKDKRTKTDPCNTC